MTGPSRFLLKVVTLFFVNVPNDDTMVSQHAVVFSSNPIFNEKIFASRKSVCNFVRLGSIDGCLNRISSGLIDDGRRQPAHCRSAPRSHEPWVILRAVLAPHVPHTIIVANPVPYASQQIRKPKHMTHFVNDNTYSSHFLTLASDVSRCAGIHTNPKQLVLGVPCFCGSDR